MTLTPFQSYLVIINVIGLILYFINTALYRSTANLQIDKLITAVCLLGGSIGVLIPVLILRRKLVKENESIIMLSVFLFCIIPIQIVLYLIIKSGVQFEPSNKSSTFLTNRWLLCYLLTVNIVSFIVYGLDKLLAKEQKKRIKILTLLILGFIGGEFGGYLAMKLFHHKTNKDYFSVGLPLMMIMHIVLLFYIVFV